MGNIVHCRICGQEIDKSKTKQDVDWVRPSRNYYYHCNCYHEWKAIKNDVEAEASEQMWFESLKEYLYKDLKMNVDFSKLTSQWKHLLKDKKTPKGIYFTIKYFYEVQHGSVEKSQGGIGIVSSIYNDAGSYWQNQRARLEEITHKLKDQYSIREQQQVITFKNPTPKKKAKQLEFEVEETE